VEHGGRSTGARVYVTLGNLPSVPTSASWLDVRWIGDGFGMWVLPSDTRKFTRHGLRESLRFHGRHGRKDRAVRVLPPFLSRRYHRFARPFFITAAPLDGAWEFVQTDVLH
jgi:hypothetical protein